MWRVWRTVEVVIGAQHVRAALWDAASAVPADSRSAPRPRRQTRKQPIAPCGKAMRRANLREQPGVTRVLRPRHGRLYLTTKRLYFSSPALVVKLVDTLS